MTTMTRAVAGTVIVMLAGGAASMHGVRAQGAQSTTSPATATIASRTENQLAQPTAPDDSREMAICKQMVAAIQASESRIESLAETLRAATGNDRVPIMADLLLALADDRLLMRHPTGATATEPGAEPGHHMTTPSRAQGAGLVARGQMQHLMESMASAMRQPRMDMMQMMSRCSALTAPGRGEVR